MSVSNVPEIPGAGHDPSSRNSGPWADLIAFLGILALGGVLVALGHATAGSVATVCAALGTLFAVWKRCGR
jgi:hypothetical protein